MKPVAKLVDTRDAMLIIIIDKNGGADIKAQNGCTYEQAVIWLREAATVLERKRAL